MSGLSGDNFIENVFVIEVTQPAHAGCSDTMRLLKITIITAFIAFSAACYFFSDKKIPLQTHHAQTFQRVTSENIKGDFERENRFEFGGVKAEMSKNGADFFIAFETENNKEIYKIEAVVGNEKLEEYIAKKDEKLFRLPIAYDLRQKRWMNLNSTFFEPDGADFFKHQTDWNANCASCHLENVSANLKNFDVKNLNSDAILLGCGSCHAKGLSDSFPKIAEIISNEKYSSDVISAHQNAPQNPNHFFEDGSTRLASHEYQGILRSVCFVKNKGEKINCLTCHSVENGKIDVKTDEKILSLEACTSCHQQFSAPNEIAEHTKHQLNSKASNCYSCHLPEVVYGHLEFQKTHEISIPNPELTAQKSVPNACNLCHTDKSVNWAILQTKTLWTEHFRDAKISNDTQFDEAESIRGLFAGDAFTRALSADSLTKNAKSEWFAPFIFEAFKDENYPLVRYFMANSLLPNENFPRLNYLAPKAERTENSAIYLKNLNSSERKKIKDNVQKLRLKRKALDFEFAE